MLIRWIKRLVLLTWLLLTIIAIGAVVAHYKLKEALAQPLAISENTEIQIRAGQSVRAVLLQWQQQGWIKDEIWLRLALKRQPELANIKVGTYELPAAISAQEALQQLVDGKELQFSVTLVEGGTVAQWLTQVAGLERLTHSIESPAHLAELLAIDNANPEGWFYPDTYSYSAGSSDLDIFRRAYLRMEQALAEAWEQRQDNLPLKSPYEMLILASIVEKETAVAEERPMVASVFVNRLNIGMRLQTDPTVIYGAGDDYQGSITRKHLDTTTPYNTYRINGLTPTPIANPSLASLLATVQPEQTPYLYFVANGEGGHTFSQTLQQHNAAVRHYRSLSR